MTIVQSPEEREHSRRVLAPWLVKLRSWRMGATTRKQKARLRLIKGERLDLPH